MAPSENNITKWTPLQVSEFLTNLGIESNQEIIENEISGDLLLHANHSLLQDLGFSFGNRFTILNKVYSIKLKNNLPFYHGDFLPCTIIKDLKQLQQDFSRLKDDLIPVWVLVKEYKTFQMKSELKKKAQNPPSSPLPTASPISPLPTKSPNKSINLVSPSPSSKSTTPLDNRINSPSSKISRGTTLVKGSPIDYESPSSSSVIKN